MAFGILSLIYGGLFTLIIISKIIFGQNRNKNNILQKGKIEAVLNTLGYYYLSGVFMTFFTKIFTCWKKAVNQGLKEQEAREISSLVIISIALFWIPLTKVYFAVKADYNRRISSMNFGCRKNNKSNSSAYLLQMFTIFFFYILEPYLGIFDSMLILIFGIYTSFYLKLKSEEFICQQIRSIEVSSSLLSTLTLIALIILTITKKRFFDHQILLLSVLTLLFVINCLKMENESLKNLLQFIKDPKNFPIKKLEQVLFSLKCTQTSSQKQLDFINSIKEELFLEINLGEVEERKKLIASYNQNKKNNKQTSLRRQTTDITSHITAGSTYSSFVRKKDSESLKLKENSIHRLFLKSFLWDLRQSFEPIPEEFDKRISFFYFLFDFMKMKEEAKDQIMILEKHRNLLRLEQKLELTRIKQLLIESGGLCNSGEMTLEVLDPVNIKRKMMLRKKLEKATFDYHSLWSTLREITPDIKKVKHLLLTSFSSIKLLKKFWENNFLNFSKDINILMLYSTFLRTVLKEKKEGEKLLKKIEIFVRTEIKKRNEITEFDYKEKAKVNSSPICLIETSSENLIIKSCNNQFSVLFGYTKQELIGKNLLQIITIESLDFYMEKFHSKKRRKKKKRDDKKKLEKKKLLVFTRKGNFLKSFWTLIKMVENHGRKTLVLKIDIERVSRPTAEILTSLHGKVKAQNESFSQVFNLKEFLLKDYDIVNLKDIAEEFSQIDLDLFESGNIDFFNLITKEEQSLFMKIRKPNDSKRNLLINFVKVDDIQKKISSKTELFYRKTADDLNRKNDPKIKKEIKKFYFSLNKKIDFEGKYYLNEDGIESEMTQKVDYILNRLNYMNEIFKEEDKKDQALTLFPFKKNDYGNGIRVKRLFENRICDIFEFDEAEFQDEELLNESRKVKEFRKIHDMKNQNFPQKKFKKKIVNLEKTEKIKNRINKKLSSKIIPNKIKHLITINMIIFLVTTTAFFINLQNLIKVEEDSIEYIEIFSRCPIRNEYTKFMFQRIFDIAALNEGIHPYYKFRDIYPMKELMKENIEKFEKETKKMDEFWKIVSRYYHSVNAGPLIDKYTTTKDLKVQIKGKASLFAYDEFFEITKSAADSILDYDIEDINFEKQQVFFIETNMHNFSTYSRALTKKIKVERDDIVVRFQGFKQQFINVFLALSILTVIILVFLNLRVLKFLEKRIKIFYEFEDKYMKKIIKKCENYLIILYREESNEDELLDDNLSELDNQRDYIEYEGEKEEAYLFFRKKKKSKGKLGSIFNVFTFLIITFVFINFYIINLDLKFQEELVLKLQNTSEYILAFGRFLNKSHFIVLSLTTMMKNPKKTIGGLTPKQYYEKNFKVFEGAYQISYVEINEIYKEDKEFFGVYERLFMASRCGENSPEEYQIKEKEFKVKCSEIFNGMLKYNLLQPLSHYHSKIVLLLKRYLEVLNTKNQKIINFGEPCQDFPKEKSIFTRNLLCLYTSELVSELKLFMEQYFFPTVQQVNLEAMKSLRKRIVENDQKGVLFNTGIISGEILIFLTVFYLTIKSKNEFYKYNQLLQYHDLADMRDNDKLKWELKQKFIRGI